MANLGMQIGGRRWGRATSLLRAVVTMLTVAALLPVAGIADVASVASVAAQPQSATTVAQTIAQGVDLMPEVPVAWRVLEATAEVREEAPFASRTLGFVLGDEGDVLVTDEETGDQTVVAPGEAAFQREGASHQRASLEEDPTTYAAIELIVADAAEDPETVGDAELAYVSDEFTAPSGNRELSLSRAVLDGEETAKIEGSDATTLLYVTDGELGGTDEADETLDFVAGDIASFSGSVEIEAGEDGATYVFATIGREVEPLPEEPAETGTLQVTLFDCPEGTDPQEDASGCEEADDAAGVVVADVDNPDDAIEGDVDGATITFAELAPSTYALLGLRDEDDERIVYAAPPAEAGQQDYLVEVGAGEDVDVDVFRYPDPAASDGTLSITIFDCPEGVNPAEGETDGCDPGTDDFGASVQVLADEGDASGPAFALSDAERDGDAYVLSGLPSAVYTLLGFGPINPDTAIYAGPPAETGQSGYVVEVSGGETIALEVYRFTPDGGSGETGTLVLTVYDCPPGVDATVDASACEAIDDEYLFYVYDLESLEILAFTDDAARDGASYLFDLAPGMYGIASDNIPAGVLVAFGGDTETTQDGAQITIEAGATASADAFVYVLDEGEVDTDGDGVSDVDEEDQGTDPDDPADN